jgi:hypothetical protein
MWLSSPTDPSLLHGFSKVLGGWTFKQGYNDLETAGIVSNLLVDRPACEILHIHAYALIEHGDSFWLCWKRRAWLRISHALGTLQLPCQLLRTLTSTTMFQQPD